MSLSFNGNNIPIRQLNSIPTMMKVCREMVHEAIRAYVTKDLERASALMRWMIRLCAL